MKYEKSDFYCTECACRNIPVFRKSNKRRKKGHLKKLYCPHCRKYTNNVEISEYNSTYTYEDFLEEFNNGVFVNGKRVK